MNENVKRLFANAIPDSTWRQKVKWRHENRHWLKKSTHLAIGVLMAMREQGINKEFLAYKIGVTPEVMNLMVRGEYNFSLKEISKLEVVLGINLLEINKEEDGRK